MNKCVGDCLCALQYCAASRHLTVSERELKSSTPPYSIIEDNLGGQGLSGLVRKSVFQIPLLPHLETPTHRTSPITFNCSTAPLQIFRPYQHKPPHFPPNKHPTMAATTTATAIASLSAPHTNQHFESAVPARYGVAELKEELSSFSPPLPTTGLKPILQARLQLAYLGFQCKEREEEIGGWYRLDKAALHRKCATLGIEKREVYGKSMQVLLRMAIMKFCMFVLLSVSVALSVLSLSFYFFRFRC